MCDLMLNNGSINRFIKRIHSTIPTEAIESTSVLTVLPSYNRKEHTCQDCIKNKQKTTATTTSQIQYNQECFCYKNHQNCNHHHYGDTSSKALLSSLTASSLTSTSSSSSSSQSLPYHNLAVKTRTKSTSSFHRRKSKNNKIIGVQNCSRWFISCLRTAQLQRHQHNNNWQFALYSIIILLLCCTSHVLAIRKGRLMTPNTFTALSGDLHVQIQFQLEEDGVRDRTTTAFATTPIATTTASTTSSTTISVGTTKQLKFLETSRSKANPLNGGNNTNANSSSSSSSITHQSLQEVENIITSTLVISKYIDDIAENEVATNINELHGTVQDKLHLPLGSTIENNRKINANDATNNGSITTSSSKVLQRKRKEIIQNIPLYPDPRHNVTQVAVPCQTFMQGGLYEMQVVTNLKTTNKVPVNNILTSKKTLNQSPQPTMVTTTTTLIPVLDERLRQTLDVRWPSAEMIVSPVRLKTYPDSPVEVTLRFPDVNCEKAWSRKDLPEFWLELIYCGKERLCSQLMPQNISKSSILFAEQVRGYPKHKAFKLSCDLFGLAGNYAVQLRPMIPAPNVPITRRFLSVDWSEKYVFNVYARSIFPCDPHTGIGVLYEYPACILEQGDRVRVYAKLRADVASLKPPTTLHYVSEQRVVKNQYSLYFNCDLFTEKFVEYCFVYVSQAISGAVADVRMDCVPTLPVKESDTGGWGPWSEWTPCSTNCLGGTRNRYRFCDSPPPRYGAKFCSGSSVQTEKCGSKSVADTWDCIYETAGSAFGFSRLNRTDVSQEIGPGCRCGCIVHLGASKPKRIIAGATQSCPGRSFWLIQVDGEENIALQLNFLRLPCATQYIKIRDGPSLSSTLITEIQGGGAGTGSSGLNANGNLKIPIQLDSTGAQLLIEFYAGEDTTTTTTSTTSTTSTTTTTTTNKPLQTSSLSDDDDDADEDAESIMEAMHTVSMCTGGFLANVEQIVRNSTANDQQTVLASTRLSVKSHKLLQKSRVKSKFTLVHLSAVVFASIIILISALLGAQYVVRYHKYHLAVAKRQDEGSRLHTPRASMTSLQSQPSRAISTTTLISEVIYLVKMRPKHQLRHSILRESIDAENLARETEINESIVKEPMVKCVEEFGSSGSIVTLRNEIVAPTTESVSRSPSVEQDLANDLNESPIDDETPRSCGTLTRKDSGKDSESIISSGMSSICNSPPMNLKRISKYSESYDAATLKMTNSYMEDDKTEHEGTLKSGRRMPRRNSQSSKCSSVNMISACYSPAASIVSSATIRSTTNPKESKEKQNLKKLLARPGSEFSLGTQQDFEMDYYDYNVTNAGAAPGSYLGMDPAHLIWIPPFDDVLDSPTRDDDKTPEPTHEPEECQPLYGQIKMPKYGHYLSPHSNGGSSNTTNDTTPTSDELSPLNSNLQSKASSPSETDLKNCLIKKAISSNCPSNSSSKQSTPYLTRKQRKQQKKQAKAEKSAKRETDAESSRDSSIPLQEFNATKQTENHHESHQLLQQTSSLDNASMQGSYIEKETSVVKSPSDLQNYLTLDDIQFADDSESDHDLSQGANRRRSSEARKLSEKEMLTEECKLVRELKRVSSVVGQTKLQTVKRTQV